MTIRQNRTARTGPHGSVNCEPVARYGTEASITFANADDDALRAVERREGDGRTCRCRQSDVAAYEFRGSRARGKVEVRHSGRTEVAGLDPGLVALHATAF